MMTVFKFLRKNHFNIPKCKIATPLILFAFFAPAEFGPVFPAWEVGELT